MSHSLPSRGFSLLEALIALLVLSIGLLGVAGMQLKALQGAHAAYQRSIASLAAQDAQERLWAGVASHLEDHGELQCSALELVNGEEGAWVSQWSSFLPGLDYDPVSQLETCEYDIVVSWQDIRLAGERGSAFTYTFMLPGDGDEE